MAAGGAQQARERVKTGEEAAACPSEGGRRGELLGGWEQARAGGGGLGRSVKGS